MRRLAIAVIAFALTMFSTLCGAARDESVEELKARFESGRSEDRIQLAIRIAQLQLRAADHLYAEGHVDQAQAAIDDIVQYCEKARDTATQTKKHLKTIEIDVRKMAEKLRDIRRTLAFDDQAPVEQAVRRLEDVRTALLKEMFANDHNKDRK